VSDAPRPGRVVTIVLQDGEAHRALPELPVESPWWSDVEPIGAAFPGLAVLRLLEVTGADASGAGGHVCYLAERLPAELAPHVEWPTRPWDGELTDDPLRQPWAVVGGPARDLAWASSQLGALDRATQIRTWNLSAIWRLETSDGVVWLKCLPSFASHEPVVLRALADQPVPRVLAADAHRELLADMPGVDGYAATAAVQLGLIDTLVAIQRSTRARVDELERAGVPDRRLPVVLDLAAEVVARRLPDDRDLAWLLSSAGERVEAIEACGLPDVLIHGDAHPGNARIGPDVRTPVWFDWGDARIGHPLIDVAVTERAAVPLRDALVAHWIEAWRAAVPGCDPATAWQLIQPIAALGNAVVYQSFLDGIEQSERCYHRDDVDPCLRHAASLAARSRLSMS